MVRTDNRKILSAFAKAGAALLALVFVSVFCFTCIYPLKVNADSEVIIYANNNQTNIGPGDIIKIDVLASSFPGITEFGPVEFSFDTEKAEYVSYEIGKDISNYYVSGTFKEGVLTITGRDQMMNTGADGSGDEDSSASFYSDDQVVLFSVALRVIPGSTGDVNAWINKTGSFMAGDKNVSIRSGSRISVPIKRSGLSSDATISSLKIRGTSISPDFNPNITEYTCSVERSVTEVQVSVLTSNLWAAVVIGGNQRLNTGDNAVTIDVTAQDGINHMRYTVHVIRRESNIPEDSSLVDLDGKTYTFLDIPEAVSVPDGFYLTTKNINGFSVPVYVKDGVASMILYLYDGTQAPGLYFYNSETKTVIQYDSDNMLIKDSAILRMTEVPADVIVPDEFKPATFDTGTIILNGFENDDGDFICYLSDDSGNKDFYYYDKSTGSLSRYRFADKKAELLYSYLFDVFLVIAIIEAVIITIAVYIIRRLVSDRTNPRPKRV